MGDRIVSREGRQKSEEVRPPESLPQEVYSNLPVDDLVLYGAKRILEAGEECTLERLVYECFRLFPKQFGFQRYPQWPDALRINRSWWRCRTDKGWLAGSVKQGFQLTPKGERVATAVEKKLSFGRMGKPIEQGRARERYDAVLRYLRRSEAFRRYKTNAAAFGISKGELRRLLAGTLETPPLVLRQNFHFYLDAAEQHRDGEVLAFLHACRGTAEDLFRGLQEGRQL